VIAPNKELFWAIGKRWKELEAMGLHVTPDYYYRSADMLGVDINKARGKALLRPIRTCVAMGMANIPSHACDAITDNYMESQIAMEGSVSAATWQAVSRVKDPEGVDPSEAFFYGVRPDDLEGMVTWGLGREITITYKDVQKGTGKQIHVKCGQELPKPHMGRVTHSYVRARDEKALPFIKKIWFAGDIRIYHDSAETPKMDETTYIIYKRDLRQNEQNQGIVINRDDLNINQVEEPNQHIGVYHFNPKNAWELQESITTLEQFHRSKKSHHTEQWHHRNVRGDYGYAKERTNDWDLLIYQMYRGEITPGTYSHGEDGKTTQCLFDIDNHPGKNTKNPPTPTWSRFLHW
jgi:hypothetical protein